MEMNGVKCKKKKKKVSFNLNVQIFEPNPSSYQVLDNEEDENKDSISGEGSAASTIRYPLNHRYHNCSYYDHDEDDDIAYEESDIDDEFDEGYGWDDDDDGSDESLENYGDNEVCDENSKQKEDGMKNQKPLSPENTELKSNLSGRERSVNMNSVLSPVENLTQWKAMKTKVTSSNQRRKENVPSEETTSMPLVSETGSKFSTCVLESNDLQSKPLLKEIAVDASLSNWLVSPSYNVSNTIRCQ
ncbi:eisosome protein [Trifolium repens]|nr:eisosome protein [Trifolium repens]